jgi:hypothetical protein
MKNTQNYNLNLPESTDFFDIEHFNQNAEAIDKTLKVIADAHKQISGTIPLSTSLLEKSLTLGEGVHIFKLLGTNYTGNDLPNTAYTYGEAMVLVRSTSSITVVLFGAYSTAGSKLAVNHYNGSEWQGWGVTATLADLDARIAPYSDETFGDGLKVPGSLKLQARASGEVPALVIYDGDGQFVGMLGIVPNTGLLLFDNEYNQHYMLDHINFAEVVTPSAIGAASTADLANYLPKSNPIISASGGDFGGQIHFELPSNSNLSTGVRVETFANQMRIVENGGNARGAYLDMTKCANWATSELLHTGNSSPVKVVAEASAPAVGSTADTSIYPEGTIIVLV